MSDFDLKKEADSDNIGMHSVVLWQVFFFFLFFFGGGVSGA